MEYIMLQQLMLSSKLPTNIVTFLIRFEVSQILKDPL